MTYADNGTAQAGPHAVSEVVNDGVTTKYCYDANGNMIADSKRKLYYAATYDKPTKITHENGAEVEFAYNHSRSRYYRKDKTNGSTTETYYVSGGYEKVVNNVGELDETVLEKHYIAGVAVEIYTNGNATLAEKRYMHKDNLGSVVMVTDASGDVLERHSYDPWGQKRDLAGLRIPEYLELTASTDEEVNYHAWESDVNGDGYDDIYVQSEPNWILIAAIKPYIPVAQYKTAWLYLGTSDGQYEEPVEWYNALSTDSMTEVETVPVVSKTTNMGFTGHEQIDSVGLVHMGGRLYDAVLGRMLNADPFIQAPGNSQSFNRYSYVVNNPVSFNDPSGYMFNPIKAVASVISQMGTVIGDYYAMVDDIHRMVFDAAGQEIRNFARNNPRTFAILQAAGCAAMPPGTQAVGCVMLQGISTGVVTKEFSAGVQAAAVAGAMAGISHGIGTWAPNDPVRIGLHAGVGGAYSAANGGSFWRGAASSLATHAAQNLVPKSWGGALYKANARLYNGVMGAIAGGTAGVVTGGGTQAFVNGAATGFMQILYNDCAHGGCGPNNSPKVVDDLFEPLRDLVEWADSFMRAAPDNTQKAVVELSVGVAEGTIKGVGLVSADASAVTGLIPHPLAQTASYGFAAADYSINGNPSSMVSNVAGDQVSSHLTRTADTAYEYKALPLKVKIGIFLTSIIAGDFAGSRVGPEDHE